jgi:CHAT domain-containing protein/tetratricopeptide (TPR) repeat protein
MKSARLIGLLLVAMLLVNFFVSAPAIAQQDEAAALRKRAEELFRAGKFSEAIPPVQQLLAIDEKALGPTHPAVAASLNNLAMLYERQGRYADAEPLHRRALAILEKARGPDHPDVALALNNLAFLYMAQGRYAESEPLYRRALAIWEKALGPDHVDVAIALNNLADLYRAQGRSTDAEPLYKRALEIREKALGPDHRDVATSLDSLAELYRNKGRYADAEPLYRRALAIREKALGPDHPDVATSLNNLALLHYAQGRYADVEPLLRRALLVFEKALGPDHREVATTLYNLAASYKDQGRYADAEPLLRRALAIREKALGPNHPEVAQSLGSLAASYKDQGRYADAEPLLRRALAIEEKALGPEHRDVATTLSELAVLYRLQSRYADAEPLLRRALAIEEKALGPEHPNVAKTLINLATFYYQQGRYADAELLYKPALAIQEKALGPDHPDVALSLSNLAAFYYLQGRYADALPLVQTTIGHGVALPSVALPVLFAAQPNGRPRIAVGNGLIPAVWALDDALNVVQRASQSAAAVAVNKLGARLAAGSGRLAGLVRNDQDLSVEAAALDKAILAAVSKEPAKRDAAAEQRIRDRLTEIAKQRAALQGVFAAEFPDYAALSNPQPLTVKEIQALLSDGEALLLYAIEGKESYVFAVTRTSAAWKQIPLGTAALSEKVAAFRRGLDVEALRQSAEGGKPVLFDLGLANDLYVSLVGPVDDLIKDAHHLLVVPSGPLTSLPFHLLVTEKPAVAISQLKDIGSYRDAAWLIKRQSVSVLPALASLKALRRVAGRDPGAKPLVGFGDPVFDPTERAKALAERRGSRTRVAVARGYGDFWQGAGIDRAKLARSLPSLLDTADELKAVAGKLGASAGDVHLGSDASETTVKRTTLADYRVVYFATHGLVAGDVVGLAEPSLALTLPKQPTELDDGLLTASEVAQLKLNADWVVLSACNTAAADKPGAEALSGLARAFFYAGARALLVSHWSVDSEAATRLTTSTFAIMKTDPKLGRAAALRDAMLAYMNDKSSPLNAYPAFWGPFSIIGEGAAR